MTINKRKTYTCTQCPSLYTAAKPGSGLCPECNYLAQRAAKLQRERAKRARVLDKGFPKPSSLNS